MAIALMARKVKRALKGEKMGSLFDLKGSRGNTIHGACIITVPRIPFFIP